MFKQMMRNYKIWFWFWFSRLISLWKRGPMFLLVTDTYSSSVNLVTEPIQNDSLSLTCRYTGNETVDYFVWHYYAPSINTLDVVRNDSCISTIKLDTRFTNLKYKFGCSEINSNTIIFERLSLDMLIEAMSCTVRTIEQNWSSNDRLLFTYGEYCIILF
jgi:hypothetical protein